MERNLYLRTVALACLLATPIAAQSITVRDGAGLPVTVKAPAKRVGALVSSSLDIVVGLGAADRVVARTRYDTASVIAKAANVGGGLDPSIEVLLSARPDLFIAWQAQASTPVVMRLRALGIPVYLADTRDTAAMFATVKNIGALLGLTPRATMAANQLRAELRAVQQSRAAAPRLKAVYVVSRSPVIIAAAKSFIAELISVAGADNPFADVKGEFPTMSLEAFIARDPDVLIVGKRDDGGQQLVKLRDLPGWRDLRAVRNGAVIEVDSEQWGRPTLRTGALVRDLAVQLQRIAPIASPRK